LGDYFRQNIDNTGDFVLLSREIEHLQSYLAIEEARFEERIKINFSIEIQCHDSVIPPLILQPLVENAVKHGLFPKKGRGNLYISATRNNEDVIITVEDDGVGMNPDKLKALTGQARGYKNIKGIGFHNVNERMAAIYGESYRPQVESAPGRGTRIILRIPFRKAG
jgi:two-component system sensor histidine kinase LytS